MKAIRTMAIALIVTALIAPAASSQVPAKDPSARLREVLPPDVAQRVLAASPMRVRVSFPLRHSRIAR